MTNIEPVLSLCCHLSAASRFLNVASCLSSAAKAAERLSKTVNYSVLKTSQAISTAGYVRF